MYSGYFNHYARAAETYWDRRTFVRAWWKIYASDRRWAPPPWSQCSRLLTRLDAPHLARMAPHFLHVEALPGRRRQPGEGGWGPSMALMEEPVAAAVLLADPRRRDGTAYLALLHLVNDEESWDRLLGVVMEHLWTHGRHHLVGPTGLSPHWASGVLQDHFHVTPPWLTPYNPPYLPEVVASSWQTAAQSRLYHAAVPNEPPDGDALRLDALTSAELIPLVAARLAGDLLLLMVEATSLSDQFPRSDALEAEFILSQLAPGPTLGWLAQAAGQPIGFVLLAPDLAGPLLRAKGGRNPLWRLWLAARCRRPVASGRVLLGAVDPAWRRRGIGRLLWQQALTAAQAQGWRTLTAGPVPDGTVAAHFLAACGATPQQRYALYTSES